MTFAKKTISCWKCGATLSDVLLPLSRQEECPHCFCDLHACKSCLHYKTTVANACTEDRADFIVEKEKANFCEYIEINPDAYRASDNNEADLAKVKLAELFGDSLPESEEKTLSTEQSSANETEAEKALAELKRLFGDD